jgi:hypothetical protein
VLAAVRKAAMKQRTAVLPVGALVVALEAVVSLAGVLFVEARKAVVGQLGGALLVEALHADHSRSVAQ